MKTAALIVATLAALLALREAKRAFFYPAPPQLPAEVSEDPRSLIARLEGTLHSQAPMVLASLNPGLPDEQIRLLEQRSGVQLPEDLRALYRWHNGQAADAEYNMLPGHRFTPLQEALQDRDVPVKQAIASGLTGWAAFEFFAGHRDGWITVFADGAGDGYFLDTRRMAKPGYFFYNMAEVRYYVFFPSVRNFLAGLAECYAQGAIRFDEKRNTVEEDTQNSKTIWRRFSTPNMDD
jgi:cell wall assembly regulator SMI1